MFGTKGGPGNKGKDGGLQEPNGIFLFFFWGGGGWRAGINLSYNVYAMTDNLSNSLQSMKISTVKGKKCTDL